MLKIEKNKAVIYIIRDFNTTHPTLLRFAMTQEIDPDSRDKLEDALTALDGDSTKGAGIPFDHLFFQKESFVRLEMPPGKYSMFTYFAYASVNEIAHSRKSMKFNPGEVYIFKIVPRDEGAYNSTIYFLEELKIEEGKKILKTKNLKLLEFNPIY